MAIPKYNEMMPAVIEFLGDGEMHTALETAQFVAKTFGLTEAELQERLPSGVPCVSNRVGWALAYLKKAGLIERPKRACYRLTRTGQEAYRKGSACVTLEYLRQFPSFTAYVSHQDRSNAGTPSAPEAPSSQTQSPQEMMDAALAELNASLADDLMTELMKISDTDFERLVAHLLIKMGYGSLRLNEDAVTKVRSVSTKMPSRRSRATRALTVSLRRISSALMRSIFRQNAGNRSRLSADPIFKNSSAHSSGRGRRRGSSSRRGVFQREQSATLKNSSTQRSSSLTAYS